MVNKPFRKYIDKKMVQKIEETQKEIMNKTKSYCSFQKASKILAGRINK